MPDEKTHTQFVEKDPPEERAGLIHFAYETFYESGIEINTAICNRVGIRCPVAEAEAVFAAAAAAGELRLCQACVDGIPSPNLEVAQALTDEANADLVKAAEPSPEHTLDVGKIRRWRDLYDEYREVSRQVDTLNAEQKELGQEVAESMALAGTDRWTGDGRTVWCKPDYSPSYDEGTGPGLVWAMAEPDWDEVIAVAGRAKAGLQEPRHAFEEVLTRLFGTDLGAMLAVNYQWQRLKSYVQEAAEVEVAAARREEREPELRAAVPEALRGVMWISEQWKLGVRKA